MRIILEFSSPQPSEAALAPDPFQPFRVLRSCPCCDSDLIVENYPNGVVIVRLRDAVPPPIAAVPATTFLFKARGSHP
jgi:hypothetical protein